MNLNDLRKKRNEILALAEKHSAGNVRVFDISSTNKE
jgi:hypothetical protein